MVALLDGAVTAAHPEVAQLRGVSGVYTTGDEGTSPFIVRAADLMHTHHAIDYVEFTVRDLAEAKQFYAAAFGWTFNDYGPGYAGIQGDGRELGGLRQTTSLRQGGPLVVLFSNDLDASLAAVRAAGGTSVLEPFAFPGGRRFHFADPSGNELAVWAAT